MIGWRNPSPLAVRQPLPRGEKVNTLGSDAT